MNHLNVKPDNLFCCCSVSLQLPRMLNIMLKSADQYGQIIIHIVGYVTLPQLHPGKTNVVYTVQCCQDCKDLYIGERKINGTTQEGQPIRSRLCLCCIIGNWTCSSQQLRCSTFTHVEPSSTLSQVGYNFGCSNCLSFVVCCSYMFLLVQ